MADTAAAQVPPDREPLKSELSRRRPLTAAEQEIVDRYRVMVVGVLMDILDPANPEMRARSLINLPSRVNRTLGNMLLDAVSGYERRGDVAANGIAGRVGVGTPRPADAAGKK